MAYKSFSDSDPTCTCESGSDLASLVLVLALWMVNGKMPKRAGQSFDLLSQLCL